MKNLNTSSGMKAPLSRRQEVSCNGNDGDGNESDNWVLACSDKQAGEQFMGGD